MDIQQAQGALRATIIEIFDIDKLAPEEQEKMITKIGGLVFQAVLMRILPTMSEEDQSQYEALIDNKAGADELLEFLMNKVPNFMDIVIEESENFRKDAAEVLSKLN